MASAQSPAVRIVVQRRDVFGRRMTRGAWAAAQGATEPALHHGPQDLSDRIALFITHCLRFSADLFFAKRYGHRAVVLETVATVPGMVGATITHLHCLRRMVDDDGWIRTLMDEAENERMHLMSFVEIARPTAFERLVVVLAQGAFYIGYFGLYLASRRTAHRLVGYFEEEAVRSYTLYLDELENGRLPNPPAPAIAKQYWKLSDQARLTDVLRVIRDDEAVHRDVNHRFASALTRGSARSGRP
jgi:ubiquinol oxidase